MGFNYTIAAVIGAFIYIIIVLLVIHDRCDETECKPDFSGFNEKSREATTKDAWIGICWPVLLVYVLFKTIINILNEFTILPCLLVGIKYKNTIIYKNIEKWVEI